MEIGHGTQLQWLLDACSCDGMHLFAGWKVLPCTWLRDIVWHSYGWRCFSFQLLLPWAVLDLNNGTYIFFFALQWRLLKGRSIPGKVLLTRRADPPEDPSLRSSTFGRSFSENDAGTSDQMDMSKEVIRIIDSWHQFLYMV